jgi:hypothetical protein
MRKPINFLLSVMLMTGIAPGQGSEFWHKKEYRQWSEKECNKLLDDSPWAKKYTLSRIYIDPLQRDTGDRERVSNPEIKYVVQLRSARPIRQALVRQSQIAQNYDKLPADQQQQFDTKAEEFLSARFPDTVIVYVSYTTNVQNYDRELARHWQLQTTERLRNFVFLIGPKGDKVPLLRYTPAHGGGREFQFAFPREFDGRPVLTAQDKSLKLEFPHPPIGELGDARVLVEFKVDKMVMQGEVVY